MKEKRNRSIIVLYEIGQIDAVLTYFGIEKFKNGDGPIIVPIDYEIEIALRYKNIPFYSMVGYSERSSLKERATLVSGLTRKLYFDREFDFFKHNEIKLGRIIGYSLGEYLLRILYYLDIFEIILQEFKGVDIIYMTEPTVKLSSTVGQLAKFEIFASVNTMAFLAQKNEIHFEIIICKPAIVMEKKLINDFVKSYSRNIFILLIKLLNSFISLFQTRSDMKIFVSDYWWHIDAFIMKMKSVEITMMERKEVQNAKKFIWRYKIRFNHPSDYLTRKIRCRAEERRQFFEQMWKKIGEHNNFSKQFVWHDINFWKLVEPACGHLVSIFSGKVVEMIESTERLFKKQQISAVVLRASVSGQIHFAILGLVAHKMGIPAIELQHGLEFTEDFSLSVDKNADILASYGPLIKKELKKNDGININALDIGSPRFDQYRNEIIGEEKKNNLMKKIGVDSKRPVLLYIATDIVLGQTHDTYSMLELFNNIVTATDRIDGLQVVIKIRPCHIKEFFFKQSIAEVFGKNCYIAQYENLHELISISSIVASSFSTVILEAMIGKRPVILVGINRNDRMLMESHFLPYEQAEALRIARTEEEITRYLQAIVSNPNEGKLLIQNANNFIKKNFCFDGRSAERMVEFLEALRK